MRQRKYRLQRRRPAVQHNEALIDGLVDESSQQQACAQVDRAAFGCNVAWDWRSSPSARVLTRRRHGADGCGSLLTPLLPNGTSLVRMQVHRSSTTRR
jgi:hypothetical protein